jgi:CBS domain-containing protein
MQSACEKAAARHKCHDLVSDEQGDSPLGYAVFVALVVAGVVLGASFLTPTAATHQTGVLGDPRLWIQCSAIVLGFALYYVLWRRAARLEQEELEALDIRTGTQAEVEAKLAIKRLDILGALATNPQTLSTGQLSVRYVMTTQLITLPPRATIEEARQTMADNKLRHLLICQDERLLGVISDRDLTKPGRCAADIMARKPVTVTSDTEISPAVSTMMHKRISCLPVVEGERLVGLFTTTDLIMTLQCAFQLLQTATEYLPLATASTKRHESQAVAVASKA